MTQANNAAAEANDSSTNVEAFIQDLDGGMLERKLGLVLSKVAAASMDNNNVGEVSLKFSFKRIPGTNQVHVVHMLKFQHPTISGKAGEEESRTTPMYVGKFGRLSLAPESQMTFLDKKTDEIL